MQYNDFLIYLSMFSCIFPRLKIFRCSKIFRDLERSSKVKDLFEDLCKIFFTEMNKLNTFNNLFKIFMRIFKNLGSLKIEGLQRSS